MPEQVLKTEIDVAVEMRDGTVLRADVYRPDAPEQHPTLIVRAPYNKANPRYHIFLDPIRMAKNGYAVVWQDCRGTWASDGEFQPFVSTVEAEDGYDTVEWAAKQPWSNGRVGMYGGSYHAFTQLCAAKAHPPHLKAIFPAVAATDAKDLIFPGGALSIRTWLFWSLLMSTYSLGRKPPSPQKAATIVGKLLDAFDNIEQAASFLPLNQVSVLKETSLADYYFEWLEHIDDETYWQERNAVSADMITLPAYFISGWYDVTLKGSLSLYKAVKETGGSDLARKSPKLLLGPWTHNIEMSQEVGEVDCGMRSAGAIIDYLGIIIRWFDFWLKETDSGIMDEPQVRIFVMGDNAWRNENEWPLTRTEYRNYYLHSGGRANTIEGDGVLDAEVPGDEKFDTYIYDPLNPVPTKGGNILTLGSGAGAYDQQAVEERADVLVYTTPVLETAIEVTGPLTVKLFAASSAKDTDFTAKLVDVWPDGRAYNLADGIIRARYRDSSKKQPATIEPGHIYEYSIDIGATSNVFKAGHRIRLEISSSNFPQFNRNLNTGNSIGQDAEIKIATQQIFHNKKRPSHIVLPVIPR